MKFFDDTPRFSVIADDVIFFCREIPDQYAGGYLLGSGSNVIFATKIKPKQEHIDNHFKMLGWVWVDNV